MFGVRLVYNIFKFKKKIYYICQLVKGSVQPELIEFGLEDAQVSVAMIICVRITKCEEQKLYIHTRTDNTIVAVYTNFFFIFIFV